MSAAPDPSVADGQLAGEDAARRRLILRGGQALAGFAALMVLAMALGAYPFTTDRPAMAPLTAIVFLFLGIGFHFIGDDLDDTLSARFIGGLTLYGETVCPPQSPPQGDGRCVRGRRAVTIALSVSGLP